MKWEKIGEFAVDSGMFMICDPCYVIDSQGEGYVEIIKKKLFEDIENAIESKQNYNISFKKDHNGLAVAGDTRIGDGFFEVYSKINCKGQKEIKVVFK